MFKNKKVQNITKDTKQIRKIFLEASPNARDFEQKYCDITENVLSFWDNLLYMKARWGIFIKVICISIVTAHAGLAQNNKTIGFDINSNRKKAEIPFENYNNLILIPVVLNNALPLKFILDTGVRTTILTDRTLSDLISINYDRKIPLVGVDGSKIVDAFVANDISLQLPGVSGKGQSLLVLAEDFLQLKNYLGVEVHGILGYELFRRFIVKINYDRKIITLYEPAFFKPNKRFTKIPMTLEDTKPYLKLDVTQTNGKKISAKLLVDTGASHTILLNQDTHADIEYPERKIESVLGRSIGGSVLGFLGRVKKIEVEKFQFEDVIASFPEPQELDIYKEQNRNGTIGGGLLGRFITVIDYFNEELYLKKGKDYRKGFEYNMSGIEVKTIGRRLDKFVIQSIRKDSPAERAGLLKEDKILILNGHTPSALTLNDINSSFRSKEGRKIKITIERDGVRLKKQFRLEKVL